MRRVSKARSPESSLTSSRSVFSSTKGEVWAESSEATRQPRAPQNQLAHVHSVDWCGTLSQASVERQDQQGPVVVGGPPPGVRRDGREHRVAQGARRRRRRARAARPRSARSRTARRSASTASTRPSVKKTTRSPGREAYSLATGRPCPGKRPSGKDGSESASTLPPETRYGRELPGVGQDARARGARRRRGARASCSGAGRSSGGSGRSGARRARRRRARPRAASTAPALAMATSRPVGRPWPETSPSGDGGPAVRHREVVVVVAADLGDRLEVGEHGDARRARASGGGRSLCWIVRAIAISLSSRSFCGRLESSRWIDAAMPSKERARSPIWSRDFELDADGEVAAAIASRRARQPVDVAGDRADEHEGDRRARRDRRRAGSRPRPTKAIRKTPADLGDALGEELVDERRAARSSPRGPRRCGPSRPSPPTAFRAVSR